MKYVTFSFDDGFLASTIETARIFESFGLRVEFNVTAAFAAIGPGRRAEGVAGANVYALLTERSTAWNSAHFQSAWP